MAKNKKRMAQNRAQKKARAASKKKRRSQRSSGGRFARMGCTRREIETSPVYGSWVGNTVFSQGIGHVLVARKLPDGAIAAGFFLVDPYCLGIKNAFLTVQSTIEFDETLNTQFLADDLQPVVPAYARKLIDDAVAYARNLGFEPHRDFRDASVVLGDIDPTECKEEFTFGHEGKPLYISGPHDSEARSRRIVAQLMARCGPDGAHYMIGMGDPGEMALPDPNATIIDVDDSGEG